MYLTFKVLHVLGVVLLIGNVTVSAVWKVFANRTADITTIAFAQRLVTYTDWALTLGGVALVIVGGYGMALVGGLNLAEPWLVWGQALFVCSGLIWISILVPIQMEQSRIAQSDWANGPSALRYRQLCRRWIIWGVVATVPLIAALIVMVVKPS